MRRVLAALAAIILAIVGAVLLTTYVRNADQRAMAGLETTTVLVVTQPVARGTAAESLGDRVEQEKLPITAVAEGAVGSVDLIAGQVATADLVPGEQVLASRFADPESLRGGGGIDVPAGMQEVSLTLSPDRTVGSSLSPGDTVGVFVTLDGQTHLVLHKVLVTRVQPLSSESETGGDLRITVALTAPDAERFVFAAENASVWLSLEPEDASVEGTRIVNGENALQ